MRDLFVYGKNPVDGSLSPQMSLEDKLKKLSEVTRQLKSVEESMGDELKTEHMDEFEKRKKEVNSAAPVGCNEVWWKLANESEQLLNIRPTLKKKNLNL